MKIRQLEYFCAAVEELSFSGAARKFHVSQPCVSRTILKLETELGTRLLERGRLGLQLTPAGEQFLLNARRILADCTETVQSAQQAAEAQRKLSVGFIPTVLHTFLGNALKKFRSNHPAVKLNFRDMVPGEQIAALRNREIELGILANLSIELAQEFEILVLSRLSLQAAVPVNHRLSGEKSVYLKELERDVFLLFVEERFPGRNRYTIDNCIGAGYKPMLGGSRAGSLVEMIGMIGAGMGVCLIPSDVGKRSHPNVVFLPLKDTIEPISRVAAWLPGNGNPALQDFLECLKESNRRT